MKTYICPSLSNNFNPYTMLLSPSILIIEDHDVVVFSIKMTIKEIYPDAIIHNVDTFGNGVILLNKQKYDLVILDIGVPEGESYRMVNIIKEKHSEIRVLIFSGKDEQKYGLGFLNAGADGFLSKSVSLQYLRKAIGKIMDKERYVSDGLQQLINSQYFKKSMTMKSSESNLSPRESEVLELLLKGKFSKEIANELKLKESTVGTHKARIFQKMDVTNIIELFQKVKNQS